MMSSKLRRDQREKVQRFIAFTQSLETVAITYLNDANWNLQNACNAYFENPNKASKTSDSDLPDLRMVDALFAKYANDPLDKTEPDRIGPHGMMRFLKDLNLSATDRVVLALAWKLAAEKQCEFSKEEFRRGMNELGVDSLEKLKERLPKLKAELADAASFRGLYQFAFTYAKSALQKGLLIEVAVNYWKLLFNDSQDRRIDLWVDFLRDKKVKSITRDTWNLFLDFLESTSEDYSNYDVEGAWPVLIDEFVEYAKSQSNK